jgi:hypothetical protein
METAIGKFKADFESSCHQSVVKDISLCFADYSCQNSLRGGGRCGGVAIAPLSAFSEYKADGRGTTSTLELRCFLLLISFFENEILLL